MSRSTSLATTNSPARAHHDLRLEAAREAVEQLAFAEHETRLEKRRAHGHVGLRRAQAFLDRARRMTDLQTQIPQEIEDRLDHALAPGRGLIGEDEQKVDVRTRRQEAAPVAARGDHRHALRGRGIVGRIELAGDKTIGGLDQPIHGGAKMRRATTPIDSVDQDALGFRPALVQHFAKMREKAPERRSGRHGSPAARWVPQRPSGPR